MPLTQAVVEVFSPSKTCIGIILHKGAIPDTPLSSSLSAAANPATCVPCPSPTETVVDCVKTL